MVEFSRMTLCEPTTTRPGLFGNVDVLGQSAEDGALEHTVVLAERRALFDGHSAIENAAWADDGARLDDAEGTDLDVRADLGRGTNNRRWVNAHGRHLLAGLNG